MQENTTIARPYARAAFEHARKQGKLQEWSEMLALLGLVIADPLMRKIINDPRVGRSQLAELIFDIGGEHLFQAGRHFVKLLIDAGRIQLAPEISRLFEQFRAQAERVVDAEVISAYALEEEQERTIVEAVKRRIGKEVKVLSRVDRGLIGGVVIRIGDLVIDASVRGRLKQLANQFV